MSGHVNVLGFVVTQLSADSLVDIAYCSINEKPLIVNTINPHSYVVSKTDKKFEKALKCSNYLIPDGSGIVLAGLFFGKKITKNSGFDLFISAMHYLNEINGRVFFLGSSDLVLESLKKKISQDFGNIVVGSYSPPYKEYFDDNDIQVFISKIQSFKPTFLFVGLTAPKQEKLIFDLISKSLHGVKMVSGIGAVFDFYSGSVKRPSKFWIDLHLEWLIRLLGEPKRLWRRNFISTPLFLVDLLKSRLGFKLH